MKKQKTYWAGFMGNKMDIDPSNKNMTTIIVFTKKKHAPKAYADVRPVRIVEVERRKK